MNANGVEERRAAARRRAHAEPEAVADAVLGCEWLDATLAALVEAAERAGEFEDLAAWPFTWFRNGTRVVHVRAALHFRKLARSHPAFPVPAAHSTEALLDTLATLAPEPGAPPLLALIVEGGPAPPIRAPGPRPELGRPVSREAAPEVRQKPVVQLLADVRAVFEAKGDPDRLASAVLDRALCALPGRPWQAMPTTGKPLSAQLRGRMLAAVGIRAKTLQFAAGKDAKGYERAAFKAAWSALL